MKSYLKNLRSLKTMSKKRLLFCGIFIAFATYVIWSGGGLYIANVNDFDGQRDIVLVPGLKSDVWLSPKREYCYFPLLFHYIRINEPFGLRLQIWDTSKQYESIEITEMVVEYKDGETIRVTAPWNKSLRLLDTKMMLSDTIPKLVLRHADVRITLSGYLIHLDGRRIAFQASEDFEARSVIRTATFWEYLNSC